MDREHEPIKLVLNRGSKPRSRSAALPALGCRATIAAMFKRRSLDVYSAKPSSGRVKIDGFEFSPLEAEHFAAAEFCRPRLELFRRRLAEGFAAHGLLTAGGELAYYMWLSFADDLGWASWALGARIKLPASSGYIFDCKTAPEHRNRGLYTAALQQALWLCHKAKCSKVFIDVEPTNVPAVRAIQCAGFDKLERFEILRVGPMRQVRCGGKTGYNLGIYPRRYW